MRAVLFCVMFADRSDIDLPTVHESYLVYLRRGCIDWCLKNLKCDGAKHTHVFLIT